MLKAPKIQKLFSVCSRLIGNSLMFVLRTLASDHVWVNQFVKFSAFVRAYVCACVRRSSVCICLKCKMKIEDDRSIINCLL